MDTYRQNVKGSRQFSGMGRLQCVLAVEGIDEQTRQTNVRSLIGSRVSNVYKQVSGCGGSTMLPGQEETSYTGGPKSKALGESSKQSNRK